ncbi:Biofilm regulator 1 [Fusarium oxysporum f. sp. albedinis]|nr:Biofilm regulator 1 [Fusarium oxysporum f. sp. albedinis]
MNVVLDDMRDASIHDRAWPPFPTLDLRQRDAFLEKRSSDDSQTPDRLLTGVLTTSLSLGRAGQSHPASEALAPAVGKLADEHDIRNSSRWLDTLSWRDLAPQRLCHCP